MLNTTVGKNIRYLRDKQGLTQEKLAMEAGLHQANLWPIEKGRANPTLATLLRIADTLGVPILTLFNEGSWLEPDYTTVSCFIKEAFPYIGSPGLPESRELMDGLHSALLKRVTLKDIRLISRSYRRKLTYEVFSKACTDEGKQILFYGVRLLCRRQDLFSIEDEVADICTDGETVRKLVRYMRLERLSPRHFREVIDNFSENDYQLKVKMWK